MLQIGRAVRFHDVGSIRSPYTEEFKGGLLAGFASRNFRMNEFTGAVLKGRLGLDSPVL